MTALDFDARLAQLARKHRRMGMHGVTFRIRPDGLITAHPRRSLSGLFPLRTLALLVLSLIALKALFVMALGTATYAERVEALRAGSPVERAGAWLMQPEPITTTAAEMAASLAR